MTESFGEKRARNAAWKKSLEAPKNPARAKLSREHFAFLRGYAQGLGIEGLWDRYLLRLGEYDVRRGRKFLKQVHAELGAIARRSGRPEVAALLARHPGAIAFAQGEGQGSGAVPGKTEPPSPSEPGSLPTSASPPKVLTFAQLEALADSEMPSLEDFAARFDADMYSEAELQELWSEERTELLSRLSEAHAQQPPSPPPAPEDPADARQRFRLRPPSSRALERRDRLIRRQLEMLDWMEQLACESPVPEDPTDSWLDEKACDRLRQVGVNTLGELSFLVRSRGYRWYSKVPRLGEKGAAIIVSWLQSHESALGPVPFHSLVPRSKLDANAQAAASALPLGSAASADTQTFIAPLERLRLPASLATAGFDTPGSNRASALQCKLDATNDFQAVQEWLALRPSESNTWRAYRREAERFLLWAVFKQGKPLSALTSSDCVAYRDFLANPGPEWVARRNELRWSPTWRPFEGPLSSSAAQTAVTILSGMCEWLSRRRYLDTNPWDGVPKSVRPPSMPASRSFTRAQWEMFEAWLAALPEDPSSIRLRALVGFAYRAGLRVSELSAARTEWFRLEEIQGRSVWSIMVLGKRQKWREVALPYSAVAILAPYFELRGLATDVISNPPDTPLFAKLGANEEAGASNALTAGRLYEITKTAFEQCAAAVCIDSPAAGSRFLKASTHWLRHTYGTHGAESMPLDILQKQLGHASPTTTGVYVNAELAKRHAAIEEAFGALPQGPAKS